MNHFVRHDLMCTDPAAGARFYGELFGWKLTEIQAMGFTLTRLSLGERVLGAIMPFGAEHGVPSHWMPYVQVPDVDACCKRVVALGGKVGESPTDVPPGRFAVASDVNGAWFSPFAPKQAPVVDQGQPPVGAFAWNELLSNDIGEARRFYGELFGWSATESDMGKMGTYIVFAADGKPAAGMLGMPPDAKGPPMWLPYVRVADADVTVEHALKLGAKVFVPPNDIPNVGRFSVLGDPTGATVGIVT